MNICKREDMSIRHRLQELSDEEYASFQAKLLPTVPKETVLGVRVPVLRRFAQKLKKEEKEKFLQDLPHKTYDENMLHAVLLSQNKDFSSCEELVKNFLPYIDNWAVCDTLNPKILIQEKEKLLCQCMEWLQSDKVYTVRFGIDTLMRHFLDNDFSTKIIEAVASVRQRDYYVDMAVAWFFATALSKRWEETLPCIEQKKLPIWVHNKTIQKCKESYRITPCQKDYLQGLLIR